MKISIRKRSKKTSFILKIFLSQLLLTSFFSVFCLFTFTLSQGQGFLLGGSLLAFAVFSAAVSYYFSRPFFALLKASRIFSEKQFLTSPFSNQSPKEGKKEFPSLAGILNALSDEVEKTRLLWEEEKKEKEAILESLEEGVIVVDGNMNISYANAVGSKMLGISRRHLQGRTFPLLAAKDTASLFEKCSDLLKKCQQLESALTDSLSIGEGRKLYLDLIATPKEKGKGAVIVLQNKSSNFKILEMGKDFVANASHELRTPITIIKGFAETLQDLPEISPEMLSDITEKIVRNCERMDKLVKNLLTLADIENLPESRFQDCDVLSLIDNCRHVLLSVYPDCTIDVEKNVEKISISADADILELAISNLMDNAAKYSPTPAHITIEADLLDEEVKIVITDRGIGIPQTDVEHIFERFYTVNKARSRRLGGAGLGLSLVKTIIEKHEGMISVKSVLGQGTSFTIFLPRRKSKKI